MQPSGYVSDSRDCNDTQASVKPGATEVCNGVDDNCSGAIDEEVALSTWYRDADGDGRGSPSVSTRACSAPAGYVSTSDDCNDSDNTLPRYFLHDSDRDGYGTSFVAGPTPPGSFSCTPDPGYSALGGDCNDGNSSVHPGAAEACDRVDNNCNGSVDEVCSVTCSAWFSSAPAGREPGRASNHARLDDRIDGEAAAGARRPRHGEGERQLLVVLDGQIERRAEHAGERRAVDADLRQRRADEVGGAVLLLGGVTALEHLERCGQGHLGVPPDVDLVRALG
ncbi:hypothetical protein F0U60_47605 [Archangium minus]|uniref:Lipoprotein n=1 Tax=Archangium minus TaxID=83450 RepID=A0ABY9X6D2_9BACT|nr:hypothetical protein F0U60_47605 [Archangium minus]